MSRRILTGIAALAISASVFVFGGYKLLKTTSDLGDARRQFYNERLAAAQVGKSAPPQDEEIKAQWEDLNNGYNTMIYGGGAAGLTLLVLMAYTMRRMNTSIKRKKKKETPSRFAGTSWQPEDYGQPHQRKDLSQY
jgi:hypothetical protein